MFYIDENNSIRHGSIKIQEEDAFESLDGLGVVAELRKWSKQTVTDVWNGFAGTAGPFADLKPCKCFKNRPYGLAKIWAAIQRLAPASAASEPEQSTTPILEGEVKVKAKKKAAKKSPKAKHASKPKGDGKTKRDEVIRLMSRARGASATELMEATGWQPHSLRGAISTMGSKGGLTILSEKDEKRGRVYRIAA